MPLSIALTLLVLLCAQAAANRLVAQCRSLDRESGASAKLGVALATMLRLVWRAIIGTVTATAGAVTATRGAVNRIGGMAS